MGIVFDIQRFALHDGPGIRTTVFLKGCPLRCLWCHNPESQLGYVQYSFDYSLCTRCLKEGHNCTQGVSLVDGVIKHDRTKIRPDLLSQCPYDAVKAVGQATEIEPILAEALRDRAYYDRSGGGLTISGGEPLTQFSFCLDLAQNAKARGLHVCLDTTGHAPQEQLAAIAPYVDIFLYDYKATDSARHKELTGVGNELILANLDFLYHRGAGIILRCPLVPGVNDSDEHLAGIAAMSRRYPNLVDVHIMAYHDMGNHKAVRVGQEAPLAHLKTVDEETKQAWLDQLHRLGCTRARLG